MLARALATARDGCAFFFYGSKRVQPLLGHCSSGAAFLAAVSIWIDGSKSIDTNAGLRCVTDPRKRDLFAIFVLLSKYPYVTRSHNQP